jgi:hypothetical protein
MTDILFTILPWVESSHLSDHGELIGALLEPFTPFHNRVNLG